MGFILSGKGNKLKNIFLDHKEVRRAGKEFDFQ